ncbi:Thionin related (TAP1) [Medicago truncatula]|uniref:Thionin related (TAP1) n=1 Tax=Medicago truncatula TaxID=3880 RepID=A0A072V8A0_MEDTR|nr:Thionin related (TAP1) [Medicago truncatula]
MANYEMKKIVSIMVMIMFVVAQADDSLPMSSTPELSSISSTIGCLCKCASQCRLVRMFMGAYAACTAGCGVVKCSGVSTIADNKVSLIAAYDCATNCAVSKSNNVKDAQGSVEHIVSSCLGVCKNK